MSGFASHRRIKACFPYLLVYKSNCRRVFLNYVCQCRRRVICSRDMIDVPTIDERLALARRHVEAGRRTIVHQRQMVERLKTEGRDTKAAAALLTILEHTQKVFERDLAYLEKLR